MIKRITGAATVAAYRGGTLASRLLPPSLAPHLTGLAGRGASLALPDHRKIIERNLERIYGDTLSRSERSKKVTETFDSYVRYYYDSLRLTSMSITDVADGFTVEGLHHLEEALASDGPGPVLALPHLGGWEWAAYWITRVQGWDLAAVVERLEPPELFEWFLEFRESLGMNIIPLGPTAADDVFTAAANNEIVCLLCDRDIVGGGVKVDFFGEETTIPAGPAIMGLRGGCAVLPTGVYFTDKGVHGVVGAPVTIEADENATLRENVGVFSQKLAGELEGLIRRAPEQWHMLQPNWPSDYEALGRPQPVTPTK